MAIELPEELKRKLHKLSTFPHPPSLKIKWVERENFHITLKFFGEIEESFLKKIYKNTEERFAEVKEFSLSLEEIGFFGSSFSPRVVWFGIREREFLAEEIYKPLRKMFKKLKIKEDKNFHPHITLFRIRKCEDLRDFEAYLDFLKKESESLQKFTFRVKGLTFFKSTLTSKGPVYSSLFEVKFKENF